MIHIYLTLHKNSFEIIESRLPDIKCLIQDVVIPHSEKKTCVYVISE
jgi:hypothetical protein